MRVYVDGIFDLFHYGHFQFFKKCKNLNSDIYLIVGIFNDDIENYFIPIIKKNYIVMKL